MQGGRHGATGARSPLDLLAGPPPPADAERRRLEEDSRREQNWKRWGPYLAERQWGTVREDYSADADPWAYFPHDHARSRAYRWGEDGLLGFCDRECRLCIAFALWNERDPFLKERLFGLAGPEGNHGEDCKELYYYLDATPTYSYARALYKYPQREFPYAALREESRRRSYRDPELELQDTGVFAGDRYFDVLVEYAKRAPDDVLVRLTLSNRGPQEAPLHVLPTVWFRNTWLWGCTHEGCTPKPAIRLHGERALATHHDTLGDFVARFAPEMPIARVLFTENESNSVRLWGAPSYTPYVKDAFHEYVCGGRAAAVNPRAVGTKAAAHVLLRLAPGASTTLRLRLAPAAAAAEDPFGEEFDATFAARRHEADTFYARVIPPAHADEVKAVQRQAYAGLLWSKQFYHYSVADWLRGDEAVATPPASRARGRNAGWRHLFNRDIIAMPDKWEYPWFAAWDTAFHAIPLAAVDPAFAKEQLILLLREWYMHPNGQLPAYEYAFDDVNPPVHAWACRQVYALTAAREGPDVAFLERAFHKLLINFTWWVTRKDPEGKNVFSGGFLGLDNIGLFDRSRPLPAGGRLAQADATAWMAFYCGGMLAIALELARHNRAYEDVASKFFEHFVAIADAMNTLGGTGLWDEQDGFYYDQIELDGGAPVPLKVRSLVGLVPLFAVEILNAAELEKLPSFSKRMRWFLTHRPELTAHLCRREDPVLGGSWLLSIPCRERLERVLACLCDEREFLSPCGVRSLSRRHAEEPYVWEAGGTRYAISYVPGESDSGLFGGNSNWRGPVWFPVNFLLIDALLKYHRFFGDALTVEYPRGSGRRATLDAIAKDLARRLVALFLPGADGRRPCHGADTRYARDPHFRDLLLFHEYFHGDDGRGLGASHQTGWTALVATLCGLLA